MAGDRLTEIPVIFYRTGAGAEPVRDWLRSLSAEDRRTIGTDLATVQVGWPIACRCAARLAPGYGRSAATCRATGLRGWPKRNDEMSKSKKNPHWGSTLDEFLDEEGIREAAKAEAVTRVVAWQLSEEMKRQGISKARLAELMNTSRAQVDRILKAKGNVTIETLQRAAALVGRQVRLELV